MRGNEWEDIDARECSLVPTVVLSAIIPIRKTGASMPNHFLKLPFFSIVLLRVKSQMILESSRNIYAIPKKKKKLLIYITSHNPKGNMKIFNV